MRYNWNKEVIEKAVIGSDCYSDVLVKMGIPVQGNNSKTLKEKIKEFNIDISHFTFKNQYKKGLSNFKYIKVLNYIGTNKYIHTGKLKYKLIKEGLKDNKCEICGITEWAGKPIVCQLHHINGNNKDNRLENLQILCPNCHSQTDNYCGNSIKKKQYFCENCGTEITRGARYCTKCKSIHHRKVKRPTKEELINSFIELKYAVKVGNKYNVSDNTIRKWLKYYDIPNRTSQIKLYIKNISTHPLGL